MIRCIAITFLLAITGVMAEIPSQRVGLPLEIREIYIPGGEVKAKPRRDSKPPLSVRILEVKPAKDGGRYDFEIQGLDPGHYNLADFLDAPEGTVIPEIPLEITATLPPGLVRPHEIGQGELPELGGYRRMMIILGSLWAAGLVAILFWKKKMTTNGEDGKAAPPTLSERLRPLVDQAAKGNLSSDDRAKLERLVFGHWRERRPEIAALSPAEAMAKLRTDSEASPLILALERWLHSRESTASEADIGKLLAPYK
ncbi:MAG: hypothetical protein V4689_12060 [Verrucomicrobiota bacterium]